MQKPVSITSISSISPLGITSGEIWDLYKKSSHTIVFKNFGDDNVAPVARLDEISRQEIKKIKQEKEQYISLDDSVLFAIITARNAIKEAAWEDEYNFGINVGSSRGATSLFEKYHKEFLETKRSSTLSSPTTTLGNISSWIAQDLRSKGPDISHSITCSTALHAVLNGVAWLQSGLCNKFLVGGSEAPLTPFTIAQMKALKIYASDTKQEYPCQAMNFDKVRNSMFLGEGAGMACLENGIQNNAKALITGIGYATEALTHNISISTNADCFQASMKMAIGTRDPKEIDAIVLHAPGTIKGDLSEYNAIKTVFGEDSIPALTTNKWKIGHTFGASGILSLELAILMMQHQEFIPVPFITETRIPEKLHAIIVNAVGFGGNAVSILIELPTKIIKG